MKALDQAHLDAAWERVLRLESLLAAVPHDLQHLFTGISDAAFAAKEDIVVLERGLPANRETMTSADAVKWLALTARLGGSL